MTHHVNATGSELSSSDVLGQVELAFETWDAVVDVKLYNPAIENLAAQPSLNVE